MELFEIQVKSFCKLFYFFAKYFTAFRKQNRRLCAQHDFEENEKKSIFIFLADRNIHKNIFHLLASFVKF
jgi:hypothetical protein